MGSSTLAHAQAGSEEAFGALVAPYRRELHLHCYRMSGSLVEAEDLLQETLLAAWRGLADFAGRSSIRTWLYQIATNRCLNALRDGRRRLVTEPIAPFAVPPPSRRSEVTWLQPWPEPSDRLDSGASSDPEDDYLARETVELAFLVALQTLPPKQAAVLLLCDVLTFSTAEAASMLDTTATSVKGVLQRARRSIASPEISHRRHRPADPTHERDLARRFAAAFTADDIDAVIALLTDDAWLAMPPASQEYHGGAAISAFFRASADWRSGRRFHLVATRANTQPAFGCYLADQPGDRLHFTGLIVLSLRQDRVAGITRFLDAALQNAFHLAPALDP